MELIGFITLAAALSILYVSNRLYVKKAVIGFQTHTAFYNDAVKLLVLGMAFLLILCLFSMIVQICVLLLFLMFFSLLTISKLRKHTEIIHSAEEDNETDLAKAHRAAVTDYLQWYRRFIVGLLVITVIILGCNLIP